MIRCSNCGFENEDGSLFCEECGSKLEQSVYCENCGALIKPGKKFCTKCGTRVPDSTGDRVAPTVSVGDKNVIGGDVVGSKEDYHISGNATIIKNEDDSRKVELCPICGSRYLRVEGCRCSGCGQFVCKNCFDTKRHLCSDCAEAAKKAAEAKYRSEFSLRFEDSIIDRDEAVDLKKLKYELDIDDATAEKIEKEVRQQNQSEELSLSEKIVISKVLEEFKKGNYSESFAQIKDAYQSNPNNSELQSMYYLIGSRIRDEEIEKEIESIPYDAPFIFMAKFLIAIGKDDLITAERIINQAPSIWRDNLYFICCNILLKIRILKLGASNAVLEELKDDIDRLPVDSDNTFEQIMISDSISGCTVGWNRLLFSEEAFKKGVISGSMIFNPDDFHRNKKQFINSENESKAFEVILSSAQKGSVDAMNQLGLCYYLGCGTTKDDFAAIKWFKKASDNNYLPALISLGQCYYYGLGVDQDFYKAIELFNTASEKGNSDSQYWLGHCYFFGQGVKQDYSMAVECYQKAADNGNTFAQIGLGNCYLWGQGVKQDSSKAIDYYRKAADRDNSKAQFILGNCYLNGKGVVQNSKTAFEWFKKAADQGLAEAQFKLGNCYYDGKGVEKDHLKAKEWYSKASSQGNLNAKRALESMRLPSDPEVESLPEHCHRGGEPDFIDDSDFEEEDDDDKHYATALKILYKDGVISTSFLQNKLNIGYNKAVKLIDRMDDEGILTPGNVDQQRYLTRPDE